MSLTNEPVGNQNYRDEIEYGFYGEHGTISDSIAPGKPWKLGGFHVHFSVSFVSVEYLLLWLSSGFGSAYNTIIFSRQVSQSTDIFVHYSSPLRFTSDDQLNIELSMVSGTNVIGFRFETWAARG